MVKSLNSTSKQSRELLEVGFEAASVLEVIKAFSARTLQGVWNQGGSRILGDLWITSGCVMLLPWKVQVSFPNSMYFTESVLNMGHAASC